MSNPSSQSDRPTVAIVGGGLAGLAAAVAAAERGFHVELFEARKQLGGRAGSLRDPQTGLVIDFCQHVAMGCCTNLADFCRRTGVADCLQSYTLLHFIGPDGRQNDLRASAILPAPLHLLPGLMRLPYLTLGERCGIARTLGRLAGKAGKRATASEKLGTGSEPLCVDLAETASGEVPVPFFSPEETIGQWLRRHGQSERAIERFWSVVLLSALGETVDRASASAARKVFVDGFLAARRAYQLEVPLRPLGETFDGPAAAWLRERGVSIHVGARVKQIEGDAQRATAVLPADGSRHPCDHLIVAVPWRQVRGLFPAAMLAALPSLEEVDRIPSAPITAVHLWFDRPITRLPHAAIVGRTSQWLFHRGDCPDFRAAKMGLSPSESPHYCQVVISASHALAGRTRQSILAEVREDLESIWSEARGAELLHWRTITHRSAVFAVQPGVDRLRPAQQTPIGNLMLAGDWTATGWPATMEGAVRSGYLAVEALLKSCGRDEPVLAPDLPRSWLARTLLGGP